jgi:hypothetical protein
VMSDEHFELRTSTFGCKPSTKYKEPKTKFKVLITHHSSLITDFLIRRYCYDDES